MRSNGERKIEGGDLRERLEVGNRIVGERFVNVLVNRHRCDRREQQCLAIGRSCLDRLHAEAALGASAVFNNDRQVESGAQVLGQQPGERVARPPGGEREDDADRLCTDLGMGRQREDGYSKASE